ncbi:UPF0716 family protein affecting phage T7 exclusion [Lysobacter niastensis]|uniref:UPF0716 family protein affecting phage T7 exclusion n=1 Tax=Lysobacter niastensis TaxID=380629 RepID=A0ABU1W7T4_9GAMM|nr:hypothetical protein [Lysobacter niastensis]MDR7133662.1 UPF0716 family protein affecting phage T7 exclusion [Lysobacter niastensis]
MSAQSFRFDHLFRNGFEPRKPRHRLLRFALGLVGLSLLVVLVMFSVVLGAAMIAAGLVWKMWKRRGQRVAHGPRVVEGEFRVVRAPAVAAPVLTRRA